MKVHQVKVGTFEELRKFTIDNSQASANQYKVPRVLKTKEAVSVLLKNVVNELWKSQIMKTEKIVYCYHIYSILWDYKQSGFLYLYG